MIPEQGQLVQVRNRHYAVVDVDEYSGNGSQSHKLRLECLDDDRLGEGLEIVWEREVGAQVFDTSQLPKPDGWDPLQRFDAYIQGLRWSSNSLVEGPPLTAPFHGAIEIEAYQLVPVVKALRMNRVSLLLADDVGLGKTIEAGLVAQELIHRHRARRIMIVCPASLQRQWQEEMAEKFNLDFRIMDRHEIERLRKEYGIHVNPWRSYPRLITSMDFIKREQPLKRFRDSLETQRHAGLRDWDLLIVDEAHNCAPAGRKSYHRDSDRTRMLREIKDHFEHRLFLTATPHNGFTTSFTALLEMLDPLRFSRGTELNETARDQVMVRRLKDQVMDQLGGRRFAHREVEPMAELDLDGPEKRAVELLDKYIESRMSRVSREERMAVQFALTILKKRLLSSPEAFYESLKTHVDTLREQQQEGDIELVEALKERSEQDWDDDREKAQTEAQALREATHFFRGLTPDERQWLDELIAIAEDLRQDADSKAEALMDWIREHLREGGGWTDERLLVFTEYRDTLEYLLELFDEAGWSDAVLTMSGGMSLEHRQQVNRAFQEKPAENPVRILLGTDAASEGLNLQKHCRYLVHYEIPWNPNRMEQRNGRIDRHGQRAERVWCYHFVYEGHEDRRFLEVIVNKVRTQREDLGAVGDVIAEQVELAMVGLSDRIHEPTERTGQIDEDLAGSTGTTEEVHQVNEDLNRARREWKLYPGEMAQMLNQALQMAGGSTMEPVTEGIYRINALPERWRDLDQHLRNEEGNLLLITFDHTVVRDRGDVVLLHLGHPIMQRAMAMFRACLWEQFSEDQPGLNRCSYKIVADRHVTGPSLIAFGRLTAVNDEGRILHEDLVTSGARIDQQDLLEIDDQATRDLLDTSGEYRPIARSIATKLQTYFPHHQDAINRRFEAIQEQESERLTELFAEKADEARQKTRDLINQRMKEIRQELRREEEEKQSLQQRFPEMDEREQRERDIAWWQRRLEQLEDERETEPDKVAAQYQVRNVRVLPVGLLYVLPESTVEEGAK